MVRRPNRQLRSEMNLPLGTIIVQLVNGSQVLFGPSRNDFEAMSEPERGAAVIEALNLLSHSRGGTCWASGPEYSDTAAMLGRYATEIGAIKPIR